MPHSFAFIMSWRSRYLRLVLTELAEKLCALLSAIGQQLPKLCSAGWATSSVLGQEGGEGRQVGPGSVPLSEKKEGSWCFWTLGGKRWWLDGTGKIWREEENLAACRVGGNPEPHREKWDFVIEAIGQKMQTEHLCLHQNTGTHIALPSEFSADVLAGERLDQSQSNPTFSQKSENQF